MRAYENTLWITRFTDGPYQTVKAHDDLISIGFMPGRKQDGFSVAISRKDARLLARRINSCLDATVKK